MSDILKGNSVYNDGKSTLHCVVITAQVDMNFIIVCERIMELQPSKNIY